MVVDQAPFDGPVTVEVRGDAARHRALAGGADRGGVEHAAAG